MPTAKFLMYSFKGGAGRTVTLANTAYVMAQEMSRRVLVIDLDIESAGSSVLFGLDREVREGRCWSIQDVLRGYYEPRVRSGALDHGDDVVLGREQIATNIADFEKKLWPRMNRAVWPTDPASQTQRGSLRALPAQIVLKSGNENKPNSMKALTAFEHLLDKIEDMDSAPDILMFDSASGQQETAQMGLAYCDVLVVFVRWTRQFIVGTLQFLEEYICTERFVPRIKKVLVVPTAVPRTSPQGLLGAELQDRRKRLDETVFRINQAAGRDFGKAAGWVTLTDPVYECHALKWDDRIFLMEGKDYVDAIEAGPALDDYRRLAKTMVAAAERLTGERENA